MLRNYVSAAFGNIGRNGLYAGITILGLAVSFAAAILIGLYVRDEYSFDRFVPAHENVYRLKLDLIFPGQKPRPIDVVQSTAPSYLKLDFPEVQSTARLAVSSSSLKVGAQATTDFVSWVDPDFFKLFDRFTHSYRASEVSMWQRRLQQRRAAARAKATAAGGTAAPRPARPAPRPAGAGPW